jgi:hypothetical protein
VKNVWAQAKLFILGKDQDQQYNLYSFLKTMPARLTFENEQVGAATKVPNLRNRT